MSGGRKARSISLAVLGGLCLASIAAVAAAADVPGNEVLQLCAYAVVSATIVGSAGFAVLRVPGLRNAQVGTQALVIALTAIGAVALGAFAAARAMFISSHDLTALVIVLGASGTAGLALALTLGWSVSDASAALVRTMRELGDGRRVASSGVARAPRELVQLATELDGAVARLEESRAREQLLETSRRELVAWVSHDLRTPLAGIRAIAEALEDGLVDDADSVRRYYATLREESDRLAHLVDDLFELSRTQAGVLRLELARVALGDLVSDALAGVAPVAAAKGVVLQGRLREPAPDIEASAPELLRVLRNLLENAIRHTPSDGTVVVEAGTAGADAYVTVTDTGGGIPDADLDRVFDVAFRGDAARTPGSGAGLGLAIARGLIEAHAGEISVHNENGGATFTIRLPIGRS